MTDVQVEREGPVLVLTINRERAFNALNRQVLEGLRAGVAEAMEDRQLRAVVITGSGAKAFCAGADLKELQGISPDHAHATLAFGQHVFREIEQASKPVITAVNGLALGGGFELVLASTFPILARTATLGLPESSLGLIPGYGGTQRLPRVLGRPVAAHLMLTASRLDADRAYQWGLTPVPPVAPESVKDAAVRCAAQISAHGPEAIRSILTATDVTVTGSPEAGLLMETGLAALAAASEESTEGISAFLEKRAARFAPDTQQDED